jgi:hypothetical protein
MTAVAALWSSLATDSHYDTWLGLFQRVKQITVAPLELMEIVRLIEYSECLLPITMSE